MTKSKSSVQPNACPCGSNKTYSLCCAPLHNSSPASNAETLMRSRYSAFAMNLPDYIHRSWHHSTRPHDFHQINDNETGMQWIGLQIKQHKIVDASHSVVEFVARYKIAGKAYRLHEMSRFVFENGHWFYLDGEQLGKNV